MVYYYEESRAQMQVCKGYEEESKAQMKIPTHIHTIHGVQQTIQIKNSNHKRAFYKNKMWEVG